MQTLFAPAVGLMNRLRYRSKFLLLGMALSVVLGVLLYSVYSLLSRDIYTARNELNGLQMVKPLNRMAQFMQQHRGLSSGVLNGNEAMKDKRAAKEKDVVEALAAADASLAAALREHQTWKSIRQDWDEIRAQGLSWSAPDNIKRRTQMIAKVLLFMTEVADANELTLDPAMDTYYFMDTVVSKMPAMLEQLGIARARGTGVLTKKELAPQMKIDLASQLAVMGGLLRTQNINLEKVMRYAPDLQGVLSGPVKEFTDGSEKLFLLVREDILDEKFTTDPQAYFNQATAVIDLGYKVMFDTLIPQFEHQLDKRMSRAQQLLYLQMGLTIAIVLVVGYLGIGTYYSVINSVHNFSDGARRLADGDLTVQFDNHGADELHAAGKDFNDMASAFRALLGWVRADSRWFAVTHR